MENRLEELDQWVAITNEKKLEKMNDEDWEKVDKKNEALSSCVFLILFS